MEIGMSLLAELHAKGHCVYITIVMFLLTFGWVFWDDGQVVRPLHDFDG